MREVKKIIGITTTVSISSVILPQLNTNEEVKQKIRTFQSVMSSIIKELPKLMDPKTRREITQPSKLVQRGVFEMGLVREIEGAHRMIATTSSREEREMKQISWQLAIG